MALWLTPGTGWWDAVSITASTRAWDHLTGKFKEHWPKWKRVCPYMEAKIHIISSSSPLLKQLSTQRSKECQDMVPWEVCHWAGREGLHSSQGRAYHHSKEQVTAITLDHLQHQDIMKLEWIHHINNHKKYLNSLQVHTTAPRLPHSCVLCCHLQRMCMPHIPSSVHGFLLWQ